MSGNDGEEATPVPIPNTEVKLFSADGSWGSPPVRVGRCQARRRSADKAGLFCVYLEPKVHTTSALSRKNTNIIQKPKPGEGEARRSRK